uniref:Uncharacterized protein n=1 Tax=Palpitomonas bilix TaxID=652834 RepID=A0A7S3FY60_9EUKA
MPRSPPSSSAPLFLACTPLPVSVPRRRAEDDKRPAPPPIAPPLSMPSEEAFASLSGEDFDSGDASGVFSFFCILFIADAPVNSSTCPSSASTRRCFRLSLSLSLSVCNCGI